MLISFTNEERKKTFANLESHIQNHYKPVFVKYLDLGVKTVRIINYSAGFSHLIEKQLKFVLKDKAAKFDATLKVWQEDNLGIFPTKIIDSLSFKTNLKLRVDWLMHRITFIDVMAFDPSYSPFNPIVFNNGASNTFTAQDNETQTFYYCVDDLDPEKVIREGHIFVQHLNKILNTDHTNLVHGACVGIKNKGVLFCARGQRGKSTLSVLSMMKGFEYVSDDYLTLEHKNNQLYAYPIYSIITLSSKMYNTLFEELKDSRFLFNNARKDKYVFSIANFHDRFKVKYPIKLCMFPEIVSDTEPSIVLCDKAEKGRAIVQLIHSTVSQMQSMNNKKTIKKLFDMVNDFEFYKINLCSDIHKNTQCLKKFLTSYKQKKSTVKVNRILVDITFNLANILDTKTFTIYGLNELSTFIYGDLLRGVSKEDIIKKLRRNKNLSLGILDQLDVLIEILQSKGLLGKNLLGAPNKNDRSNNLVVNTNGRLSFVEWNDKATKELIK